jgi:hypothetical protein
VENHDIGLEALLPQTHGQGMDPPAATQVALKVGVDQAPCRLIGVFLVGQNPQL